MKKVLFIVLLIFLLILSFAGGVFYWTYVKINNVADSAKNAAKNSQSIKTSVPTDSSNE